MYLDILIDIKDDIPEITSKNISHIDNYLGSVGTNNIFTKKDFLSVVTQKYLIDKILNWLIEQKIINFKYTKCPNCGEIIPFNTNICNICSFEVVNSLEAIDYEIISNLNYSSLEKEAIKNKQNKLNDISYKLLCSRLNQKIRNKEKGYIIFIDLADSTELAKQNAFEQKNLINSIHVFFKDLMFDFYRRYAGIYVKSDGDSCWIYLDNIQCVKEFLHNMANTINSQNFVSVMKDLNISLNLNIFLKIYLSSSVINEFSKTDNHSIDFDALDAFTYISRVEKEAKKVILTEYSTKNNFPYFLVSTSNDFGKTEIHLSNINNFPTGFDIWYSDVNDLIEFI